MSLSCCARNAGIGVSWGRARSPRRRRRSRPRRVRLQRVVRTSWSIPRRVGARGTRSVRPGRPRRAATSQNSAAEPLNHRERGPIGIEATIVRRLVRSARSATGPCMASRPVRYAYGSVRHASERLVTQSIGRRECDARARNAMSPYGSNTPQSRCCPRFAMRVCRRPRDAPDEDRLLGARHALFGGVVPTSSYRRRRLRPPASPCARAAGGRLRQSGVHGYREGRRHSHRARPALAVATASVSARCAKAGQCPNPTHRVGRSQSSFVPLDNFQRRRRCLRRQRNQDVLHGVTLTGTADRRRCTTLRMSGSTAAPDGVRRSRRGRLSEAQVEGQKARLWRRQALMLNAPRDRDDWGGGRRAPRS